jgi:hypothetical protein
MSNFENELTALINDWLKRGDDPRSMRDAMIEETKRLTARLPSAETARDD